MEEIRRIMVTWHGSLFIYVLGFLELHILLKVFKYSDILYYIFFLLMAYEHYSMKTKDDTSWAY